MMLLPSLKSRFKFWVTTPHLVFADTRGSSFAGREEKHLSDQPDCRTGGTINEKQWEICVANDARAWKRNRAVHPTRSQNSHVQF